MQQADIDTSIVLVITAHPDDTEYGAGGSVAKWASEGSQVYYCVCTNGGKGTADQELTPEKLVEKRHHEQKTAADFLGVQEITCLDYEDGFLEPSRDLERDIVQVIRRIKPTLIVTWDPEFHYSPGFYNHSDHRASGEAALKAVFPLARDRLSFPELLEEGLEPHTVSQVLLMNFDNPSYFIDISKQFEDKFTAYCKHTSQITDPKQSREVLQNLAVDMGKRCDCAYAEGFRLLNLPD
jgi:LmbE family N-acetylglucosaminyl deacetylase